MLDHLVSTNQLEEENRDKVRVALLHRHRHHCTKDSDKKSRFPTIRSLGDIVTKKEERSNSIHSHNSILSWLGRQNSSNTAPAGTGTGNDNNNNSQQPLQSTPGRSGLNNDHNKGNHDDSHQNVSSVSHSPSSSFYLCSPPLSFSLFHFFFPYLSSSLSFLSLYTCSLIIIS